MAVLCKETDHGTEGQDDLSRRDPRNPLHRGGSPARSAANPRTGWSRASPAKPAPSASAKPGSTRSPGWSTPRASAPRADGSPRSTRRFQNDDRAVHRSQHRRPGLRVRQLRQYHRGLRRFAGKKPSHGVDALDGALHTGYCHGQCADRPGLRRTMEVEENSWMDPLPMKRKLAPDRAVHGVSCCRLSVGGGLARDADIAIPVRDDITLHPIADGVWVHTTYFDLPDYGRCPANGLVVIDGKEAMLIDLPWTDEQTARLFDWIEREPRRRRSRPWFPRTSTRTAWAAWRRRIGAGPSPTGWTRPIEIARQKELPVPQDSLPATGPWSTAAARSPS